MTVLVIAPHPDDEVLGVGGTMAKLAAQGQDVHVAVMTRGAPPRFSEAMTEVTRREAEAAHGVLGVASTTFETLPAAGIDRVPHAEVNDRIKAIYDRFDPDVVFLPFKGDLHLDHQLVFLSGMVAARPRGARPATVYAYETLSETNWNAPYLTPPFVPNAFSDISDQLDLKIEAMRQYASQLRPPPHERSLEAVRALATMRGATVARHAAEAFVMIRTLL